MSPWYDLAEIADHALTVVLAGTTIWLLTFVGIPLIKCDPTTQPATCVPNVDAGAVSGTAGTCVPTILY